MKLGASALYRHILAPIPHEGSVIENLLCQRLAFPENELVRRQVQRRKVALLVRSNDVSNESLNLGTKIMRCW